jgi:N-succinyldiaminopimelate aminotransferase
VTTRRVLGTPGRLDSFGTTVFAEMSALASAAGAVNLGQGFPDEDGPPEVIEAAVRATREGKNQYPPGQGVPELLRAIAAHQSRFYGLEFDPSSEVLVTTGATEAIAAAVLGLTSPGDEVVTFEPYYDSYAATIELAGARRRVVTLRPPSWDFDADELGRVVTERTKLVLLNSPHNPTGKVFDDRELDAVATLCRDHDLVAVTDEVYEHLVFEGRHVPLASLPGMRERTVTISSAGKTFSETGWKIGWAVAPKPLVDRLRAVKQFLTYASGTPFQFAVAVGLGLGDAVFGRIEASYRSRRDLFCEGLERLGWRVLRPSGTYFATADVSMFGDADGWAFCRRLIAEAGVAAIPTEVFYDDEEIGRHLVRFAFCKRQEVLEEALARLARLTPLEGVSGA